jgi:hypothetical protein
MAVGELCADRAVDPGKIARATWPHVQHLYHSFVSEYGYADCRSLLGFSIESPDGFAHYFETDCKEDICFRNLLFVLRDLLRLLNEPTSSDAQETS